MTNIVVANLAKSRFFRCQPLYQYNYGMVLKITGVELPSAYEVDFSNDVNGTSITQIGNADGVTIPSQFFTPGQAIYCWLRAHPTADSGVTTATIVIPISPRATITDDEPTPEEQSAIDQAIAALNDAVDRADEAVEHYPTITGGIWYVWDVDAGEYVSTGVPAQGPQGNPGTDGQDGTDGFSPTATVTKTGDTATITITDKTGTTTAQISDGVNGAPGADGFSPTATVTKSGDTATITITDANGTTTAQVTDGTNGTNGTDGTDGTDAYVYIRYAANEPTSDADMKTTPDAWIGIYSGDAATAPTTYTSYTWYKIKGETGAAGAVQDVQVNGTSVVTDGVANVPIANASTLGVVKEHTPYGVGMEPGTGRLYINPATSSEIKGSAGRFKPIVPEKQHESAFYGLAKAAGDTTQSTSSNAVGNYTDSAKSAIQKMLGVGSQFELIRFIELTEDTQYIIIDTDDNSESFSLQGFLLAINSVGASDASAEAYLKVTVNSLYVYSNIIMDMPSGIRKANSKRGVALYGTSCGGIAHFSATMFRDNVNFVDENGNLIMSGMPIQTDGIVQTGFTSYGTITTFLVGSNASQNKLGAGTRIAVYGHRV